MWYWSVPLFAPFSENQCIHSAYRTMKQTMRRLLTFRRRSSTGVAHLAGGQWSRAAVNLSEDARANLDPRQRPPNRLRAGRRDARRSRRSFQQANSVTSAVLFLLNLSFRSFRRQIFASQCGSRVGSIYQDPWHGF